MHLFISKLLAGHGDRRAFIITLAMMFTFMAPGIAHAFEIGEGAMPYEAGLEAFMGTMEGPVPFAISLVGIVACGAMLIFGGEISGFMRTMVFLVLVIAVIVQAGAVVTFLGGKRTNTASPRTATSTVLITPSIT